MSNYEPCVPPGKTPDVSLLTEGVLPGGHTATAVSRKMHSIFRLSMAAFRFRMTALRFSMTAFRPT